MSQQKDESLDDLEKTDFIWSSQCQYCSNKLNLTDNVVKSLRGTESKVNKLDPYSFDLYCQTCDYYVLTSLDFHKFKAHSSFSERDATKMMIGKKAVITWYNLNTGYTITFGKKKWKVNDSVKSITDMCRIFKKLEITLMLQ